MLDYRMETFLTLCEVMNYRETARMLHISQPAVTQHIQHLEREYGCRLFSYDGHRLTKTDDARIMEEYARSMKYNELSLRQRLESRDIRELKIGATKTIGDYVIGNQVRDFLSRKENALTLIVDNTENLLRMLEENRLDFAIVEGGFDKRRFDWQPFRSEPFVGICGKNHPFCGREITVPELLTQTVIHREPGSGTRAILEQKLQGYNESLERFRRHICISSFKLILEAVKSGIGVSFVYRVLADSDPELGTFRLQGEPIIREFSVVFLKNTHPEEKIRLFLGGEG
ncbi:MAG: LysR family transcriptional regulator [Firmicutes bacterium]|nr:LysR family transcriptional regulator [Bacillota bacterium]